VPNSQLVLSYLLGLLALLAFSGLALFAVAHAKDRIIQEHRKALEAEQRLRRAQEAFTDNAHHELKTPLQIISGHLHILRQLEPRPEQTEILVRAESATRRLQDLVQDLLDFTALQQGSLTIGPELMDLEPHLRALVAEYEAQAAIKGLNFHAEGDPFPAPVACDGPRLRQALAALLDNALKFTAAGSIQVRWTVRREEARLRLRFEVADTGPGFSQDWLRLLEPFEQGTPPAHQVQQGLGLGLPLAAGLLRAMGGRMGLTPLPAGTLAWAELDLAEKLPGG
jgi:signal transduction histidine kinase